MNTQLAATFVADTRPTPPICAAPIRDAETALCKLLAMLRAWLSGDAMPPPHVRISPELIAFVRRPTEPS
jgi:hypothetical protein